MRVEKAAGALGAFVDGDLARIASGGNFLEMHALLDEYEVLFFRDQVVSAREFADLGRRFGTIDVHPAYTTVDAVPDVQILESTAEAPTKIEVWHSDMTFRIEPPSTTLLHAQIVPPYGGDTLWASARAAYEGLSPAMREMLDGLAAVNDFSHGFQESLAEPGGRQRLAGAIADNPPVEHPVIRTHPRTGKLSIYVNALFTTRIRGLARAESDAILKFLYRHIITEEYTVRLRWAPGTIAMWDNAATQHRPVNDFFPQHRKMHRITIAGPRPQ
ncbi:MAG: TauD/TfdA family dioxygenase [Gammaproteobacteria bacterium]|nr:TauD/TfdA family dioxygenase [Gammaproteobacteria bacterium]